MGRSHTFARVKDAIAARRVQVSRHAIQEAAEDDLTLDEIEAATTEGEVVEDYPEDPRGASCLILGRTSDGVPVHALWGHDPLPGRLY